MTGRAVLAAAAVAALLLTASGCSGQDDDGCGDASGTTTSIDAFVPSDASAQLLAKRSKGGSSGRGSKGTRSTVHHSHTHGDGDDCDSPTPRPSWTFTTPAPSR